MIYDDVLGLIRKYFSDVDCPNVLPLLKKYFDVLNCENVWPLIQKHFTGLPVDQTLPLVYGIFPGNFSFASSRPFEGVIAHLTKQCSGDIHDRGAVTIIGSTTSSSCYPKNSADLTTDACFESYSAPNQWFCYAFNGVPVKPTHYSVKTYSSWNEHMKNWVLQGLNDNDSWIMLDAQSNNDELNGTSRIATFSVSSPQTVRMVRISQIGKTHSHNDYLILSVFELFGSLVA
jgi:hypothetical protein